LEPLSSLEEEAGLSSGERVEKGKIKELTGELDSLSGYLWAPKKLFQAEHASQREQTSPE